MFSLYKLHLDGGNDIQEKALELGIFITLLLMGGAVSYVLHRSYDSPVAFCFLALGDA